MFSLTFLKQLVEKVILVFIKHIGRGLILLELSALLYVQL